MVFRRPWRQVLQLSAAQLELKLARPGFGPGLKPRADPSVAASRRFGTWALAVQLIVRARHNETARQATLSVVGIDLVWLDASGEKRDEVLDSSSAITAAIERVPKNPRSQPLLISRIDPYGDTRFSSGQASQLLREFEVLRSASTDPAERIAIGRVISVLRAAEGVTDEWLAFFGD